MPNDLLSGLAKPSVTTTSLDGNPPLETPAVGTTNPVKNTEHAGVEGGAFGRAGFNTPATGAGSGGTGGTNTLTSLLIGNLSSNIPQGAAAKAEKIKSLLGDDDNGKKVLSIIKACVPEELAAVLSAIDCEKLFKTVKDHKIHLFGIGTPGSDLAAFVTNDQNLPALSLPVRAALVDGMQKTDHGDVSDAAQKAITKIFTSTHGKDVTALKNAIDLGDDQNNMHNLVYRSIDKKDLRAQLLAHFAAEAKATGPSGQTKGLFDVDDTFYVNWVDNSYPKGTVYPGTVAYHRELDLGPAADDRRGDNSFLSARPHDHLGIDEKLTLKTVHEKGEGPVAVITGDILHLIGNHEIAAEKIKNFNEFSPIYPEYKKVFEGDSGQGDVYVAIDVMSKHKGDMGGAFIHELPEHKTDPALKAQAEALGVVFYETRIGQALAAYQQGLISAPGLQRITNEALADFAKVDFGDDTDKQAARKKELDRDAALVAKELGLS
ncbi:MAG: hypothetical protein U1E65_20015 [Myxococcota bacterium]